MPHQAFLVSPPQDALCPEFGDGSIREWFAYSYRVIYRVENQIVTVAAIVHGQAIIGSRLIL
jgi:hypothetical protein